MGYYLIEVKTFNNGADDQKNLFTYDNERAAVGNFHAAMGSAMSNPVVASEMLMVVSKNGSVVIEEKYEAVVA